ncbi:MAG TPA: hypothetical protein PLX59_00805 [Candidatus Cloacimonadota bacterium]|nr:hypothetical protein [Candidatus Cloacimonadota bacterium]
MNKLILIVALMALLGASLGAVSIFDIQYTGNPGIDNTYPSQYVGRRVTLEGVVTATDYRTGGFILSETIGGPYRAILVSERRNSVQIGDYLQLSGTVSETYGMTCIEDISSIRILDRNYPLPQPLTLSTAQISGADESEAYESVLVRVINASSLGNRSARGRFSVTDGSGQCSIVLNSFGGNLNINPSVGTIFSQIQGIVVFSHSEYSLNPVGSQGIGIAAPVHNQTRSWGRIKSIYR